jgi:sigma-B regulation protein RsbU (phosphoserine phosphatase)
MNPALSCCPQTKPIPAKTSILALCERYPIEIASHHDPVAGPGGDLWCLKALDADRLAIFQADLSGHCINAAFHAYCLHYVVEDDVLRMDSPALWLEDAHKFVRKVLEPGEFATAFCAIIDFEKGELTYAAACSPANLVCNGDGFFPIDGSGFPIGIVPGATYENRSEPFPPGSALFIYSDGLIETPEPPAEPVFTPERLTRLLDGRRHEPAECIVTDIVAELPRSDPDHPNDDLTVVLLRHRAAIA